MLIALSSYKVAAFHATQMLLLLQLIPFLHKTLASTIILSMCLSTITTCISTTEMRCAYMCYRPFIAFIWQSESFLGWAYQFRDWFQWTVLWSK